ncbi:hypothetical protein [Acinetobacter nosocomialis]|uniref:hypothetical protein n=1 Tax=Acinetobacter nosocomialis TaxID=106654 RepID=UPI0030053ADC
MTDLNKLRSEFEALSDIEKTITQYGMSFENGSYSSPFSHVNEWMNGAWFMFKEKAKAQAVPEHIVVPRTREVVVAIEKMVEQQVEASGITSDVFRLDGWIILDAIQEASESGAEG